jgi:hypothetical protein
MRLSLILTLALTLLGTSQDAEAKRKKKRRKGPPPVGWVDGEEGKPACYNPPDFEALAEIDRRMKRSEVWDEIMGQWSGSRTDGVSFDETLVEKVDTVLLGRPDRIEEVARENYAQCTKGDLSAWQAWARALPGKLTAGECNTPFDYTMFDHLDIETGWQRNRPICKGDKIVIRASVKDKYRVTDDGPWITVAGDPNTPTTGSSDWPCNIEGCLAGVLMFRFNGESGQSSIYVAGPELIFTAPEHGNIEYRINDTQFFDNKWFQTGGVVDKASIEISPSR